MSTSLRSENTKNFISLTINFKRMKQYFLLFVAVLGLSVFAFGQTETGYMEVVGKKTMYYDKDGNCLGFDKFDQKRKVNVHYDCKKKEVGYAKKDNKTHALVNYDAFDNKVNYTKVKGKKTFRYDKDDNCLGYYIFDSRSKKRVYYTCDGKESAYAKTEKGRTVFYGNFPYVGW